MGGVKASIVHCPHSPNSFAINTCFALTQSDSVKAWAFDWVGPDANISSLSMTEY